AVACREKPIDPGALITARTIGLDDLQRGRLAVAEQEFRTVIALAPRDPLGYANLGLTYLRAGRYAEAEPQLDRARRLDAKSPDRKSTRLNSSHDQISYAVFCLKKKKTKAHTTNLHATTR